MEQFAVVKADFEDLPEILAVQKLAFVQEAERCQDFNIQPLTETLQEVEQQYQKGTVILKAVNHVQTIIGSIRGRLENDTVYVSKLSVHPASQNQGVGSSLLHHLELFFPNCNFSLFTNKDNPKNLAFYQTNGFYVTHEMQKFPSVTLVTCYKPKLTSR